MARPRKTQQTAELQWRLSTDLIAWMREQAKTAGLDPGAWLGQQLEAMRTPPSRLAGTEVILTAPPVASAPERPAPSGRKAPGRPAAATVAQPAAVVDPATTTTRTTGKQAPAPRALGRPVRGLVEPIPKGGKK